MNKKSLFLVLTVGIIGLCQVQFLRAREGGEEQPGFFARLFGVKHRRLRNNGDRENSTLRSDPVFRIDNTDTIITGRVTTTGPARVTPKGGGTGGGRGSSGGSGGTTVAGKSGPGLLDVREAEAVENVGKQEVNFSVAEKTLQRIAPDIEGRKKSKILLIKEVRVQLLTSGLSFAELRECEGLSRYREIKEKIDALYQEIIKMSLKERIPMDKMKIKITKAIESIKQVESTLAGEYYIREADVIMTEVYGANRIALENIRLSLSADLVFLKFEKKLLTLKQVNEKLAILRKTAKNMNADAAKVPKVNQELRANANAVADKYKK